jgi:hypothetical protein
MAARISTESLIRRETGTLVATAGRLLRGPSRAARGETRGLLACAIPSMFALAISSLACSASAPEERIGMEESMQTSDASAPPPDAAVGTIAAGDGGVVEPPQEEEPAAPEVTAEALLAKVSTCVTKVSASRYAKDNGGAATIDVCSTGGAIYFTADMDIDCDGKASAVCNINTDASYQSQTAATDSQGKYLDAATLPFIVVPGVSSRWSYKNSGIVMGSVAAVIYNGKVEYGIVGDVGPTNIIGEASYAMAKRLGINPNPSTGGTASGVTYVIFPDARVTKREDHAAAVVLAEERARQLIDD